MKDDDNGSPPNISLTQLMAEDMQSLSKEEIQEIAVSLRNSATKLPPAGKSP